jgi:Flp pilus assembly protein TadG
MRRLVKRFLYDDQYGTLATEFALIAPILILMMLTTVDVGLGFYRNMQVQNAAQAGAQYAVLHGFNQTNISNAITAATSNSSISASPAPVQFCGCPSESGISATTCETLCPSGSAPGTYVTASAQSTFHTVFSYPVIRDHVTLTAQSTLRIQ